MKYRFATLLLVAAVVGCEKKEQGSQSENPNGSPRPPAIQAEPDSGAPKTDTGILKNNMPPSGNKPTTGPASMNRPATGTISALA